MPPHVASLSPAHCSPRAIHQRLFTLFLNFLKGWGFPASGPWGWGWMGKSSLEEWMGKSSLTKGVSTNIRPQACSPPGRRLGSRTAGSMQGTHWEAPVSSQGLEHYIPSPRGPAPSPPAPSSLWEAWGRGLFTPCTHRRPGQSVRRSALRYSSRGPIGAHRAAPPPKLARGKRGSGRAGCGRT